MKTLQCMNLLLLSQNTILYMKTLKHYALCQRGKCNMQNIELPDDDDTVCFQVFVSSTYCK